MERYIIMSLIFIIFLGFVTLTKATNIVPDTCMKISKSDPNTNYDFCLKAFGSNPRSSKANLNELVEISFNISTNKAYSISLTIAHFLKDPKIDSFAKSALRECLELYSGAPENLQTGLEALKSGDFATANVRVSEAMDCGPDCEDAFKDMKGRVCPFTKENNEYFAIVAISLAFTNLLKK